MRPSPPNVTMVAPAGIKLAQLCGVEHAGVAVGQAQGVEGAGVAQGTEKHRLTPRCKFGIAVGKTVKRINCRR